MQRPASEIIRLVYSTTAPQPVWQSTLAILILGMFVGQASVAEQTAPAADWLILPGQQAGPLTAATAYEDLIALYGQENVADTEVYLGEGYIEPGTAIFPDDAVKNAEIVWRDPVRRQTIESIWIWKNGRAWRTADGIGIGTTLKTLEQLNGRPFKLWGFEWDYGGFISSWEGGMLETLLGGQYSLPVNLRLSPFYNDAVSIAAEDINAVAGDREFFSNHPLMQTLDPRVIQLIVPLSRPRAIDEPDTVVE